MDILSDIQPPDLQVWQWRGQYYAVLYGAGAALTALGPLPLEEAVAVRDGEDAPRAWDDELGDELTFACDRGEVTVVEEE